MTDSAANTKLDIEQLADFLAGRASPDVAGRLRRELADPTADASELLMAFDEADGDPLNVDWSRLDEPSRRLDRQPRQQLASSGHAEVRVASGKSSLTSLSLGHWMRTVAVGLAAGLASVAFLAALEGKWSSFFRSNAAGEVQAVARPARAIKLDAELATAESLSPPIPRLPPVLQASPVSPASPGTIETHVSLISINSSPAEPTRDPPAVEVKLAGETRPTGLQMREHLAVFGIGAP
jgi:hypothetical protein